MQRPTAMDASLPHAQCPNDRTMQPTEPPAFTGLKKKLWTAADKLRSNLGAALCKHDMVPALRQQMVQRLIAWVKFDFVINGRAFQ